MMETVGNVWVGRQRLGVDLLHEIRSTRHCGEWGFAQNRTAAVRCAPGGMSIVTTFRASDPTKTIVCTPGRT